MGKLAQALIHGAQVAPCRSAATSIDALDLVRELGERPTTSTIVNSINPHRIEGQKTQAFEIVDALGDAPHHALRSRWATPATSPRCGRATPSTSAMAAPPGCRGCWAGRPRVRRRSCRGEPVPHPETIAWAIRIGNPASWQGAVDARDQSGGHIGEVTDAQIIEAYRFLAAAEGVFVEPASAASVAGLFVAAVQGLVAAGETVVCTVTGHGLKDPNRAIAEVDEGVIKVDAEADNAVLDALGL